MHELLPIEVRILIAMDQAFLAELRGDTQVPPEPAELQVLKPGSIGAQFNKGDK